MIVQQTLVEQWMGMPLAGVRIFLLPCLMSKYYMKEQMDD